MDFIKIIYYIKSITGMMITAGIAITFYALYSEKYNILLLGVPVLLLGVKVWLDNNGRYHKSQINKKYNKKKRPNKKASSKSTSTWPNKKPLKKWKKN